MSAKLDALVRANGTRFKLYLQAPVPAAFQQPEIVWVSPPAGTVAAGPADDQMYVVDPAGAKRPYEFPYLPPYTGPVHPPAQPDTQGHFDYLDETRPEFRAAHIYGVLRRVLDIWGDYFDSPLEWHFRPPFERLEVIPWLDWDNAQAGFGFIEAGYGRDQAGEKQPFYLNFDVLAHEIGHLMMYSRVGIPQSDPTAAYVGFQESAADMVALISVLHFDSFLDRLFKCSRGNLYAINELNRIGELSENEQIRIASNSDRMSNFSPPSIPARELSHKEQHRLAQPLTGAIFDILMEIYHSLLREQNLISPELDRRAQRVTDREAAPESIQAGFDVAYQDHPQGFKAALIAARDAVGERLAKTWVRLIPDLISYPGIASTFLTVDRSLTGWKYQKGVCDCFLWREIGYGFPGKH
jgi:hypothetical protein